MREEAVQAAQRKRTAIVLFQSRMKKADQRLNWLRCPPSVTPRTRDRHAPVNEDI
jgi:hypothetical protein